MHGKRKAEVGTIRHEGSGKRNRGGGSGDKSIAGGSRPTEVGQVTGAMSPSRGGGHDQGGGILGKMYQRGKDVPILAGTRPTSMDKNRHPQTPA
jgi:hypothetical protein